MLPPAPWRFRWLEALFDPRSALQGAEGAGTAYSVLLSVISRQGGER
jgi:hypothetical protein